MSATLKDVPPHVLASIADGIYLIFTHSHLRIYSDEILELFLWLPCQQLVVSSRSTDRSNRYALAYVWDNI